MSNNISINTNKVINIVTNESYHEIIIFDNYNRGSIEVSENDIPRGGSRILQYLIDSDKSLDVLDLVDAILEYNYGVTINGIYYEWDEIKHLFGE